MQKAGTTDDLLSCSIEECIMRKWEPDSVYIFSVMCIIKLITGSILFTQ